MKNSDIFWSWGVVLLNCLMLFLPFSASWLHILLALPLVFFIPGYLLTLALTHSRFLNAFYLLTFGLGLSLTLDILSGFLLNLLPWGLNEHTWIAWLSLLSITFGLTTIYLRKGALHISAYTRQESFSRLATHISWFTILNCALYTLAALLIVGTLVYATNATHTAAEGQQAGFTQLWLLPSNQNNATCTMRIGIQSFENNTVNFQVAVTVLNDPTQYWSELTLSPHQMWQHTLILQPTTIETLLVEVKLYRNDSSIIVYREVHLTLNVVREQRSKFTCIV